ncbi:hypothetical protein JHD46_08215, partial [Sulfurimonas sp. SAG-AH-194-C20]
MTKEEEVIANSIVATNSDNVLHEEELKTVSTCKDVDDMISSESLGVVSAPHKLDNEITSSSLIGFYKDSIKDYLAMKLPSVNIEVLPARNIDQEIDYHRPMIFIGRGSVRGEILGTPDSSSSINSPFIDENKISML